MIYFFLIVIISVMCIMYFKMQTMEKMLDKITQARDTKMQDKPRAQAKAKMHTHISQLHMLMIDPRLHEHFEGLQKLLREKEAEMESLRAALDMQKQEAKNLKSENITLIKRAADMEATIAEATLSIKKLETSTACIGLLVWNSLQFVERHAAKED